jgi:hypothetical protein
MQPQQGNAKQDPSLEGDDGGVGAESLDHGHIYERYDV